METLNLPCVIFEKENTKTEKTLFTKFAIAITGEDYFRLCTFFKNPVQSDNEDILRKAFEYNLNLS